MSMTTTLVRREAVPVEIGGITLYCDGFKASGVKSFAEEASASGESVITNSAIRSARVTFTGRVYYDDTPMELIVKADALMRAQDGFDTDFRGAVFSNCFLQSYSLEDCGEDSLKASVTIITGSPVAEAV